MAPASQFELAQPPNDAISSLVFAPESPARLLVSSWDKNVYLYDTQGETEGEGEAGHGLLIRTFEHRAPVMDVCFGSNDNEAFSAGMDWQVKRIDLETGEQTVLSKHSAPVRRVVYSREHSLLISASWDGNLHVHNNPSSPNPPSPPLAIPLPGKPHAMAASPSKVIVAMTSRLVHIYDLATLAAAAAAGPSATPPQPWQQRESSLKFLTRAVAAMPTDAGYATSSIEGRVAVEWFDASAESQARKYAFKCHRQQQAENGGSTDVVYPVNALAFHPTYGTFASGGGDATAALWDAEAKRRMKVYPRFPDSVAALAFSADGRYLAVAVCPGFESGMEDYSGEGRTKILVRELSETEAKPKGAK
ncbi:mitotic spindle checkpoint protein Bub3 [Diatrype stigma]|uniref:Mitotic spindle checkpoint protein Bub3 n=1 Tax=Diatrype stigma TaxID=117547 RepID=A0AAN9URQ3_9PEZI